MVSMSSPAPQPRAKKALWTTLVILLLLAGGVAGFLWWIQQPRADGSRLRLVGLGGSVSAGREAGAAVAIEPDEDLIAEGMTARVAGLQEEIDQTLFVRREKAILRLHVTAGKARVDPAQLEYVLRGGDGQVISQGSIKGGAALAPGDQGTFEIADPDAGAATRVQIRKAAP
jgi:hypothetical protein